MGIECTDSPGAWRSRILYPPLGGFRLLSHSALRAAQAYYLTSPTAFQEHVEAHLTD